jgi:predicted TPR repeat methyltransferase
MWQQTLARVGPLVLAAWRETTQLAPIIVAAVAAAEDMLQASGPEKKTAALKLVDAGVAALNAAAERPVVDPLFAQQVAAIAIDPLITTVNAWSKTSIGQ